jgi:hypothetical protein
MSYRVLVRPQVPHLGRVRVDADHINIFAGEAKKLSIVTEQEEGYDGFALLADGGIRVEGGESAAADCSARADEEFSG